MLQGQFTLWFNNPSHLKLPMENEKEDEDNAKVVARLVMDAIMMHSSPWAELCEDKGGSPPPRSKPVSVFICDFMCIFGKKFISALPFNVFPEKNLFRPSHENFSSPALAGNHLRNLTRVE